MAATASFKQQCPSCEAWVPIRDPKLIGKKIDCPKCKYRFVVEEPAGEAAEEEPAESASENEPRPKNRDSGAKRAANGKGTGVKSKGGPRRRAGEEEDEGKGKRSKGGGSSKLVVGVVLGVVAVGILVAVAIFMLTNSDKRRPGSQPSRVFANTPAPAAPAEEPAPDEGDKPAPAATTPVAVTPALPGSIEVLSNLLPPDTEGVCDVRLKDLIRTSLGRTAFATPGAFRSEALRQRLGFGIDDVDFLLQAWNFTQNWSFRVIHTMKPINRDAVKAALRAKEAPEGKIEGQEYFVLDPNPWLDTLGKMTFATLLQIDPARVPHRSGPRALRIMDDQTLVLSDLAPMKQFLAVKGRFPPKAQPKEAPKEGDNTAGSQATGPSGPTIPRGRRGPAPEPAPAESEAAPTSSGSYLTINPTLKNTLDLLERKQPVVSLAVDTQAARGHLPPLGLRALEEALNAAAVSRLTLKTILEEAGILGACLRLRDGFELTLAEDCQNEEAARRRYASIRREAGPELAKILTAALDTKVELLAEQTTNPDDPFGRGGQTPSPGPGSFRGPGFMPPGVRPGALSPGGATRPPFPYGGSPYGMPGRGMMAAQQQQPEPPPKPAGSTIKVDVPDKSVVLLTISIINPDVNSRLLNGRLRQLMLQRKGYLDMAGGQLRVHELGDAARRYVEAHQQEFPRGTVKREIPTTRAGRPYEPKQRISWLAELLPYLGPTQSYLYRGIERNKSWNDPENLGAAATLVPQFLMPNYPQKTWWVRYPGMTQPTAATHFVGIAGIGLDAPEYSAGDAAVAKKLGIFGYERITRTQDITDGASNTILMAQVPPTYKRPWLAGGGSTVQGVPEKDSIRPFVSPQPDGKRGTLVVMADGSVRFISENIKDDVFKALCTSRGGETGVIIDRDAPPVERPDTNAEPPPPLVEAPPQTTPAAPLVGEWKEFTSKEGRFTVSFPASPREMKHSQPTPFGNFDIHAFGVDLPGSPGGFMLMYFDLPEAVAKTQGLRDQIVNGFAQGFKANAPAGAKMTSEVKKINTNGISGHEFAVEVPGQATARSRVFLVKNRMYQLLTSGPKGGIAAPDTQRFFDSFKLMDHNEKEQ